MTSIAPYVNGDVDIDERLEANERANLELFGYGVKGFTLSLIETAVDVTDGRVTGAVVQALLDLGKGMLQQPVELIEGVAETVPDAGRAVPARRRSPRATSGTRSRSWRAAAWPS